MRPAVSVVLPVRDGGPYLAQAVDSILRQSLREIELLLVDDHSSDGACDRLPSSDSRLRVMRNPGRGVSSAFNFGMAAARGEFIARMDADDVALPDRLAVQLKYLHDQPDLDLCGACVEIFVEDGGAGATPLGGNRRYETWLNACRTPRSIHNELFIESPIPNPTAMYRRDALRRLGGYAEPDWPEDYDLFLRADQAGMRMGKPRPVLLRWREHNARLTRTSPRYARARFQAAKAHYLAHSRLAGVNGILIWGAGPGGRLMHDLLSKEGVAVTGFVDVHPRRIGGEKRGLPVWPIEQVGELPAHFVLVAVGAAGARRRISAWLRGRGRTEGCDFLFTA